MLRIKPQLQHKGGEDVSSFVTTWPGTLTHSKWRTGCLGWTQHGPRRAHEKRVIHMWEQPRIGKNWDLLPWLKYQAAPEVTTIQLTRRWCHLMLSKPQANRTYWTHVHAMLLLVFLTILKNVHLYQVLNGLSTTTWWLYHTLKCILSFYQFYLF